MSNIFSAKILKLMNSAQSATLVFESDKTIESQNYLATIPFTLVIEKTVKITDEWLDEQEEQTVQKKFELQAFIRTDLDVKPMKFGIFPDTEIFKTVIRAIGTGRTRKSKDDSASSDGSFEGSVTFEYVAGHENMTFDSVLVRISPKVGADSTMILATSIRKIELTEKAKQE